MKKLMTTTFFNFLLGFVMIITMSLGIIFATGQMDIHINKIKNSASTFFGSIFEKESLL